LKATQKKSEYCPSKHTSVSDEEIATFPLFFSEGSRWYDYGARYQE